MPDPEVLKSLNISSLKGQGGPRHLTEKGDN